MGEPVMVSVRQATAGDVGDWLALRVALWPHAADESPGEIAAMLAAPDQIAFLAYDNGAAVGLAEVALRHDYVNGCDSSPVGFLEGIYVAPEARRRGVAWMLLTQAKAWVGSQGCSEFASDASVDNLGSHAMHRAPGFEETQRVVFFRQKL